MKKGRSASKLCVLVEAQREREFVELVLRETSTLGVRVASYRRYETERRVEERVTSLGIVRVKVREWQGSRRLEPEYEDIRELAASLERPAIDIWRQLRAELGG
jgi:uncharacterized protein (DUF111 family)